MQESSLEEDQEIAENIQNRIFYEEATHERILALLRNYQDQGRGYLDAVTELSHVFTRMLENYSKQNSDMQIRSRRRARKKKAQQAAPNDIQVNEDEGSEDDREAVRQETNERKFNFHRFAARSSTQGCVDTFVAFIKLYKDLTPEQLKRAHRFFYRVAFKLELSTILFRVDIIQLFYNMIKGTSPLEKSSPHYQELEEFARQLFKKLVKRLKDHPELMVEMLFSKVPATMFYLEHGYDKEVMKSAPRPPAELEVRTEIAASDRISLVTEILILGAKFDAIGWLKEEVKRSAIEREAWELADAARTVGLAEAANGDSESAPDCVEQPKAPVICKYMLSHLSDASKFTKY
jgi:replication fork protection complex subunit Tof1/Swi1